MIKTEKTYLVINESKSPVCIATRFGDYVVAGKYDGVPGTLPLTLDEIQQVNNSSPVFKNGLLHFEEEYEEDLYAVLRISGWKDIMKEKDIDDAIVAGTYDDLKRILEIKDPMYFDRIYGEYIGLRNLGVPISKKVQDVLETRRREFAQKKINTAIVLVQKNEADEEPVVARKEYDALKAELEEIKKLLAGKEGKDAASEKPAAAAELKKAAPKQPRKTAAAGSKK